MALGTALFAIAMIYFLIISAGFRKFVGGVVVLCGIGLFALYQHSKHRPQTPPIPEGFELENTEGGGGKRAPNAFDQFDAPNLKNARP